MALYNHNLMRKGRPSSILVYFTNSSTDPLTKGVLQAEKHESRRYSKKNQDNQES